MKKKSNRWTGYDWLRIFGMTGITIGITPAIGFCHALMLQIGLWLIIASYEEKRK